MHTAAHMYCNVKHLGYFSRLVFLVQTAHREFYLGRVQAALQTCASLIWQELPKCFQRDCDKYAYRIRFGQYAVFEKEPWFI